MASSSSPSAPAKPSSQPLHNFELPPLLKWNSMEGKSSGSHKRHHRSMKSPPQRPNLLPSPPLRRSPPRDPAALPPRIQTHLPREDRTPPPREAVDGETKEPTIDDEFERLALLREESLLLYRRRDWWSETGKSDVIAYRRNPLKKSAFSASSSRIGRSSNSDSKTSDAAGEIDVYRRNPYKKSSFASSPARFDLSSSSDGKRSDAAGEDYDVYHRNTFQSSAFAASLSRPSFFNSEESQKSKAATDAGEFDTYHRNPLRKSFFSSNYEERKSHEKDAYHRNPLKKSAFASSPKRSEERKSKALAEAADADTYPKNLTFKKSAFASSPKKHTFSSSHSEDKGKTEKKSIVGEGEASNPKQYHFKISAIPSPTKPEDRGKIEKKSKVTEGDHTHAPPKMKSPAKKLHASSTSIVEEKKSKAAEADANPKKQSAFAPSPSVKKLKAPESDAPEIKKEDENPKKEVNNDDVDGDEEIKVWNLRPRVVKSKPTTAAGNNSKNKGQQQPKSSGGGAATKTTGGKIGGGGGEKKEEKEKLSIAISLTKQEIEEDIFALTGAKPSRRPRKRPKNVQKQLDTMFPGLWLLSITSDSYKVSENSLKG